MKFLIAVMIVFGTVAAARAQVAPEATSPGKLNIGGTLTYSARYAQIAEIYNGSSGQMTNLSGNFGYSSTSERHPTVITLGAGDSWTISGIEFGNGPYESLLISQSLNGQHWLLDLRDSIRYQNGVGVDEPSPTSPNSAAEPIQTLNTTMVNNDALARLSDKFSGSSTLSASAGYNQLEYPNGNGLNTNALTVSLELNHYLEARDSIFGEYAFSEYSYSIGNLTIDTDTALAGWQRRWTRRISTTVSAGPQWLAFQTSSPIPSSTGYSASASISDAMRFGSATAALSHGVNGGGGFLYGAEVNNFSGNFSRQFGRNVRKQVAIDLVGGYRTINSLGPLASATQLTGFAAQGDYTTKYGYAQAGRHLGRLFSVSANYMATDQSANTLTSGGILNGLWQTITFGIGFTPPPIHLQQ